MKNEKNPMDFYVYRSTALALAGAANTTDTFNIQADSDFIIQKITMWADIATAIQTDSTRVLPLVTVQLTDTGSSRNLFDNALPIPMIFGTGNLPFILPNPRRMAANSSMQIAYTNLTAATTYNVYLAFIGTKVYN